MAEGSFLLVDWLGRSAVVFPLPVGADLAGSGATCTPRVSPHRGPQPWWPTGGRPGSGTAWRRRAASRDSLAIAGTAGGEGFAGRAGGVAAVPLEGAEGLSGGV